MKSIVGWFVDNPVATNLLMILIIVGGGMTLSNVPLELFPEISPPIILVTVIYPGAAPEEVEEEVSKKIEEAVDDIDGVKRVTSTSAENVSTVTIELETDADTEFALDEVKTRVDAIENFPPEEAEKPVIRMGEIKAHVINLIVSGDTDEATLKHVTEQIRDELTALPEVSEVVLANARPYEISIEVSETDLQQYGMTFNEVAMAVRRSSVDLPGGTLKTQGGEILLRARGKAMSAEEFEALPVRVQPDGSRLLLGDVATVVDGFEENEMLTRFDGRRALILQVFQAMGQSVLDAADEIKAYIKRTEASRPEGIVLSTYWDNSRILRGRLDLLVRNARLGLILVMILLLLFFRIRLAIWVAMGMALAFLGGIWLMPVLDVSINMISLFAFIVVLGILVDDAIVVGENIYRHNQMGVPPVEAAKKGALEVLMPVILAVLTTIAAFAPMLMLPGVMGDFASVIPKVVILCLIFSLVESLLILPCHLRHLRTGDPPRGLLTFWTRFQDLLAGLLDRFVQGIYRPLLVVVVRRRYLTLSIGIALLLVTGGLLAGEWVEFQFFPPVEADFMVAFVTMPLGTPTETTEGVVRRIEEAAERLRVEVEGDRSGSIYRHVSATVGTQPVRIQQMSGSPGDRAALLSGSHLGEVVIELTPAEQRLKVSSSDLVRRWERMAGDIPDAVDLSFTADLMGSGKPIDIRLAARDRGMLREAAEKLKAELAKHEGVSGIGDSYRVGKKELQFSIRPAAEAAGLSEADLARQVRQGYFGEEAQRIQRGREDVKVMVRYPSEERRSLGDIEAMRLRLPGGVEVPFSSVAEVRFGRSPAAIQRSDLNRSINVSAEVDSAKTSPGKVVRRLEKDFLPGFREEHPGLVVTFEGQEQERRETMEAILNGTIVTLIVIFAMLAIPMRSYVQPGLIMFAIPFGVAGAVWAHYFLGFTLTLMSLIGMMALIGVVVNDSLILIDFVNRARRAGKGPLEAVVEAGPVRFRPILFTSLTTFAGLTPMLLEKSMQAKFLIPMAVALGYGVFFATGIILLLIPAAYLALEDLRQFFLRMVGRENENAAS